MDMLRLHCQMCLRHFAYPAQHRGRLPQHCPECTLRRHAEQSRRAMAALRLRRHSPITAA